MSSCLLVIASIIYRRFDGNKFPTTKFSLGKLGLAINVLAPCYLIVAVLFTFFPAEPNPTPASMNWASLMFGVVLILAATWYFARARLEYDGPVENVRKDMYTLSKLPAPISPRR
jgi:choline transport protein